MPYVWADPKSPVPLWLSHLLSYLIVALGFWCWGCVWCQEAGSESLAGQRPAMGYEYLSLLRMSVPCVLQCSWGPGMPTRS